MNAHENKCSAYAYCAVSLHEGAKLTATGNISTYFEPGDDNRSFSSFVIFYRAPNRLKACTH